ncbi:MAG: hypothetical protein IKN77_11490 [Paludibacteraceae bacterium]|nr:hypothetical protein [Paludibacteraceae bacterium]
MNKLFDELKKFNDIVGVIDESTLQEKFRELAKTFLYGGYIQVNKDYKVYIRTVEFYFHSEKESGIHDPIVYHRNGRNMKNVPYFPLMSLHAHKSGFDITFEKEGEYRASALIRSYEVKNKKGSLYLKWDSKEGMFVESSEYKYNKQSTCLYELLNGFSLGNGNNIKWIDSPTARTKEITEKTRQNVFQSESDWEYIKTDKKCERKWSFTREETI